MTRGCFITIEGGDGVGKSSNIQAIVEVLRDAGLEAVVTREPGGTELGEKLRELLLSGEDRLINPVPELLMMFAARVQHLQERIEPALAKGQWVVSDRFTDASFAYQGGGRGLPISMLEQLEGFCLGGFKPDLTLLLDLDIGTAASRANQRGPQDRFEKQDGNFKQRVRQAYLARLQADPDRIKLIDAAQPLEAVNASVKACVANFISSQSRK